MAKQAQSIQRCYLWSLLADNAFKGSGLGIKYEFHNLGDMVQSDLQAKIYTLYPIDPLSDDRLHLLWNQLVEKLVRGKVLNYLMEIQAAANANFMPRGHFKQIDLDDEKFLSHPMWDETDAVMGACFSLYLTKGGPKTSFADLISRIVDVILRLPLVYFLFLIRHFDVEPSGTAG